MPVVSVKLWDLSRLVGAELSREVLAEIFERLKLEVEEVRSDEIVYEAPHDRVDLYSAEGLARAIAYQLGLRSPERPKVLVGDLYVDASLAPPYRPYVFMTVVRNVKLDDEAISQLFQLQEKLHLTHCGNRELVSIGLYDLDTLSFPVYYRVATDIRFRPLGYPSVMSPEEILERTEKGREYGGLVKPGQYPLLVDSKGTVLSLPPIINSEDTKVTERTRDVLIDVTGTEPMLMSQILTVMTMAVYERGADAIEVVRVSGREYNESIVRGMLSGRSISVNMNRVRNLVGIEVSREEVLRGLRAYGYSVERETEDAVVVWVPPYRVDVIDEDDVVEDIAIALDYNKIGGRMEPPTHRGLAHPIEVLSKHLRDTLAGMGFTEVVNFMLSDPEGLLSLGFTKFIEVKNPKMRTYSALRPSLLPSVLLSVSKNVRKYGLQSLKIFEVGDAIDPDTMATTRLVAGAIYGPGVTLTDGLAVLRTLLEALGLKPSFKSATGGPELFIRERLAAVNVNGLLIGVLGEVHPKYLKRLELAAPVVLFELSVNSLIRLFRCPPSRS